ncbi:D-sedoheptulose 7-phosphate isomerase [Desulfosarcina sp. OttesenSCG-928-A07]|nr:D-sedoheptulose 7-phosphate isomerase [Desulfosarcina sp. OttesenSCG-928-G17]MDL2330266.1 D-sedoheptulose 7-phosphate isomerase [Desulfosarcina sp. OttesenSCG-928-A07]
MLETLIDQHVQCLKQLKTLSSVITETAMMLNNALSSGGKLLICGNGGSAADAQHFAAEIIGRFERDRRAWPAIALSTDTSILTAIGNDYGFDDVFSRQVEGLGRPGDVWIGISTSGNSANVIRAAASARAMGISTVGLLGRDGGVLKHQVDAAIVIDHTVTARIQEAHIFILHYWAGYIETQLTAETETKD